MTTHEAERLAIELSALEKGSISLMSIVYLGFHLTIGNIPFLQGGLLQGEWQFARKMAEKRRTEFSAGRTAARISLDKLSRGQHPILRRDNGSPIWPAGIIGSISHNDRMAAAIITDDPTICGLGIDIEENVPLPKALIELVLTRNEMAQKKILSKNLGLNYPKVLFSAKEAVFKADWPRFNQFLDFCDIECYSVYPGLITAHVNQLSRPRHYYAVVTYTDQTIVTVASSVRAMEGCI